MFTKKQVKDWADSKLTLDEIGKIHGITGSTISYHIKKYGLKKKSAKKGKKLTGIDGELICPHRPIDKEVLEYCLNKKMSIYKMTMYLKAGYRRIKRSMRGYGMEVKNYAQCINCSHQIEIHNDGCRHQCEHCGFISLCVVGNKFSSTLSLDAIKYMIEWRKEPKKKYRRPDSNSLKEVFKPKPRGKNCGIRPDQTPPDYIQQHKLIGYINKGLTTKQIIEVEECTKHKLYASLYHYGIKLKEKQNA